MESLHLVQHNIHIHSIVAIKCFRLCMKYISQTMRKMETKNYENTKEENISIVERILLKTGNPKLAAVLALDLLLVGVDTVISAISLMLLGLNYILF